MAAPAICADAVSPEPGLARLHLLPTSSAPAPRGLPITRDLRLRVDTLSVLAPDSLDGSGGRFRQRFASSMFDYYPVDGGGLHVSAGLRFYTVANFAREAERTTHGLLYTPRLPAGTLGGMRTGFKRQTPAMTLGYTRTLHSDMAIGFEAGTLLGRVNASMPRSFGSARLERIDGTRINPVANLVFGYKF